MKKVKRIIPNRVLIVELPNSPSMANYDLEGWPLLLSFSCSLCLSRAKICSKLV